MGGFWAVSRYDDVVSIARASERFNNSGGPQFGTGRPPLEVDRPEHTFYRRVLQPYFGRERVAQLEPAVRGLRRRDARAGPRGRRGRSRRGAQLPAARAHALPLARAPRRGVGGAQGDLRGALRGRGGPRQRSGRTGAMQRRALRVLAGRSSASASSGHAIPRRISSPASSAPPTERTKSPRRAASS